MIMLQLQQINQNLSSIQVLMKSENSHIKACINKLNVSVDWLNRQLDTVILVTDQQANSSLHLQQINQNLSSIQVQMKNEDFRIEARINQLNGSDSVDLINQQLGLLNTFSS
jgi:hypothetical protein